MGDTQQEKRLNFLKQLLSKKELTKDLGKTTQKMDRSQSHKKKDSRRKLVHKNSDSIDMELIFDILEKK